MVEEMGASVRSPSESPPIAGVKSRGETARFWSWVGDREITSYAMARPYIGAFYEEATAVLLGAKRLKTEAEKICPDLLTPKGNYVECKSIGRHGDSLLYEHRIDKYQVFMDAGHRLYYVLWRHRFHFQEAPTQLFAMRAQLAAATKAVAVVPGPEVHSIAWQSKSRFTSYSGQHRTSSIYKLKPARMLPRKAIKTWFSGQMSMAFLEPVHGEPMPVIPMFGGQV